MISNKSPEKKEQKRRDLTKLFLNNILQFCYSWNFPQPAVKYKGAGKRINNVSQSWKSAQEIHRAQEED